MLSHALLLLAAISSSVWAQTDQCDDTAYYNCQNNLNRDVNYTGNQPWYEPQAFRSSVEANFKVRNGIRGSCSSFRKFKQCMGPNYAYCITPVNIYSFGPSQLQAYQFVSFYNEMHFACGAGLQTFISNDVCMRALWTGNSAEQINAIRNSYEIKSDASPDQACQLANSFITAFEQLAVSACSIDARDAQFWTCEYARVEIFTRFPQCNIRCVLPGPGTVIG